MDYRNLTVDHIGKRFEIEEYSFGDFEQRPIIGKLLFLFMKVIKKGVYFNGKKYCCDKLAFMGQEK